MPSPPAATLRRHGQAPAKHRVGSAAAIASTRPSQGSGSAGLASDGGGGGGGRRGSSPAVGGEVPVCATVSDARVTSPCRPAPSTERDSAWLRVMLVAQGLTERGLGAALAPPQTFAIHERGREEGIVYSYKYLSRPPCPPR